MNSKIQTMDKSRISPSLPSLSGVVLGLICNWIWPWPIAPYAYVIPVGILFIGLVVVMIVWLVWVIERNGTLLDPSKETTAFITTGPYRFSRNPAYLALAILLTTLGLILNNVWVLLMTIPVMIVIHYVIILPEEAYLETRFGNKYLNYKSRVRRWI
jgi:protein-S-isoprenylcysteine O-methyltransferase Ste14